MGSWALSADLRSPQAIASTELAQVALQGEPLAQGVFRSTYASVRQHAIGGGKKPRQIDRSRRAAYQIALDQARLIDPAFLASVPDGWLDDM